MILWCDGGHDPAENMRRDLALLEAADAAARGEGGGAARIGAVLRVFRFAPPGITLGRSQDPARTLDLARCERAGVPWAVRPTGGRAIFHADEWTYSIAATIADPEWGGSLTEAYARASALVVRSLVRLGVPASLAAGGRSVAPAGRAPDACFAATARHEIVLGGRKLVGSAQRRTAHALLQQGSVLLGPGHLRLADYLAMPDASRERARRSLEASTAHAGDRLGAAPPLERWAEALAAELPAGTRRLDAAAGAFQLTPAERGSYTPRAS
jgi:lipoate-protein ligase A